MKRQDRSAERRAARLIAFGVILYAAVMNLESVKTGIQAIFGMLTPIIIGCVVALVLDVPAHSFESLFEKLDKKGRTSVRLRNAASLILAIIVLPLILFVLIKFVIPQFISAITNVVTIIIENEEKISAFVARFGVDPTFVSQTLNEGVAWITQNLATLTGTAINTVMSVFSSVLDVVLGIILAIYLLADKPAIKRRCARLTRAFLPEQAARNVNRWSVMFISTFRTFLGRQCLEAVILGAILLASMLIFKIPYALTIACMTAILALIPYLGAYISCFVGVVLVVTVSPLKALIFVIVFLVAQQVEGNVIYPRVVGRSVGLPAYLTLSAVVIGGAIAGVAGMFFIIPVVSVFYVLMREVVQKRNAEKDAAKRIDSEERDGGAAEPVAKEAE